jgi:hypothetical protein
MRSTPVVGGGLFGESIEARSGREDGHRHGVSDYHRPQQDDLAWSKVKTAGVPAEITVKGEVYNIRISRDTWQDLKKGFQNSTDSRGIPISGIEITAEDDTPVTQRLQGFVRNMPLSQIQEHSNDGVSEISEDTKEV